MTTTGRRQQRYDHRLRDLVQRTWDMIFATDLGVPRSTARGWLGKAPEVVISLDVTDLRASELQQELLELRRRVKKLTALLRLVLALLRSSGFTLTRVCPPSARSTNGGGVSVTRYRKCRLANARRSRTSGTSQTRPLVVGQRIELIPRAAMDIRPTCAESGRHCGGSGVQRRRSSGQCSSAPDVAHSAKCRRTRPCAARAHAPPAREPERNDRW
jgi:hypothetical protein